MTDLNQQKPSKPPGSIKSTLSVNRNEIDERDPTLRVMPDGAQPYTVLLVERVMNIGSDPKQEVTIRVPGIQPRHARLMLEGSSYRIFDVTGKSGVLVNGQVIDSTVLRDGAIIRLQDETGQGLTMMYANPVEQAMGTSSVGKITLFEKFPFLFGRDPNGNVHLTAMAVSWQHAKITEEGGKHILADMGSTNGTFVNDRKLVGPYRLQPEDVIRIDQTLFVYKGIGVQRLAAAQKLQIDAVNLEMTYTTNFPPPAKSLNTMRGVSLSIHPQEFVAIIGGSGSGKSTLMRALNGAQRATGGQIRVNGEDFYANYEQYQPVIGYVPQKDIVQDNLSIYQTLWYGGRLRFPNEPIASIEQRISRALEALELTDFKDRLVRNLSGGQKKRVSIALELMADPRLLFMDEPSSGLDPGLDYELMDTLRRLADRGHNVIIVTHTTLNIEKCDHIALMARGNLAYFGPPREALSFFGVKDYPEIYTKVQQNPDENGSAMSPTEAGAAWAEKYRQTTTYINNVTKRMLPVDSKAAPNVLANIRLRGARRGTFVQQLRVLTERTVALVRRDFRTILAMMIILPLVGLFLGLISFDGERSERGQMLINRFNKPSDMNEFFDTFPLKPVPQPLSASGELKTSTNQPQTGASDSAASSDVQKIGTFGPASDAQRLLFMMSLAVVLLGLFTSAYTVVEERSLFMRERMVNLRIPPYLSSKVVVYGGLALVSSILFMIALSVGVRLPDQGIITWGPLEVFITLLLTSLAGISIGLLLSATATQTNAVTYAVLGVLFIQILFPGVLFKMDGPVLEPLSRLTVTRWSLEALGGTADMVTRDAQGRIVVERPLRNKDNQPIGNLTAIQFFPSPSALSVTYPTEAAGLLVRWGALLAFIVIFFGASWLALNRTESF
ncbi:MAG: ATP-binding cassette domain-containing protein [Anaerolineae bacterium]|nr:ATP-binding cassette domain-containing protein [Anaerolineae bacterium]